jgi:plastocyanin
LAVTPAFALLLAAACSDDDSSGAKSTVQSSATKVATAVTGAGTAVSGSVTAASGAKIDQKDLAFKPDKLSVKVGETVTFTNQDDALHTVVINGKNESGTQKKGDTFKWKAPSAGTYKITCEFHPDMHAEITVS